METKLRILFPSALLALAGCGGGGGGGAPIASSAAEVTFVSPEDGSDGVAPAVAVRAVFSKPMDASSLTPATFHVIWGEEEKHQVAGAVAYDPASSTATFTPASALSSSTKYEAVLTTDVRDVDGSPLPEDFVWTFTTADFLPPAVVSSFPWEGLENVSIAEAIQAEFSEAIDSGSVDESSFVVVRVEGADEIPVSGTRTSEGKVAAFVPDAPMFKNAAHRATLTTAIRDLAGNHLAAPYSLEFKTLEDIPPTVVSTNPAAGAKNVPSNAVVEATFDEPMAIPSITPASFFLKDAMGQALPAKVSYDPVALAARLVPDSPLPGPEVFTAVLTTAIQDSHGNALASEFFWSFESTYAVVGAPTPVDSGAGNALVPQIAVNSAGTLAAAWQQKIDTNGDGTIDGSDGNAVHASPYDTNAKLWPSPVPLNLSAGNYNIGGTAYTLIDDVGPPQIALTPSGTLFFVFKHNAGTVAAPKWILSLGYLDSLGAMAQAFVLPGAAANPDFPKAAIASDGAGNVTAVWEFKSGAAPASVVRAIRFVPPAGWGTIAALNAGGTDAQSPGLAVNAAGDAIVVWKQKNAAAKFDLYAARFYFANNAWTAPAGPLDPSDFSDISAPQPAIDAAGKAVVVWDQRDAAAKAIVYARTSLPDQATSGNWGAAAAALETLSNFDFLPAPQVAAGASGEFFAIWRKLLDSDGNGQLGIIPPNKDKFNPRWSRLDSTGAWAPVATLALDDHSDMSEPKLAGNDKGDLFAVWTQRVDVNSDSLYDATGNNLEQPSIAAKRYLPGSGWTPAGEKVLLLEGGETGASAPQGAVDVQGKAYAIWRQVVPGQSTVGDIFFNALP